MNKFEEACNEIENEAFTGEMEQENVIEFLKGEKTATISFTQGKYANKIKRLAEEYPDDVRIVHEAKKVIVTEDGGETEAIQSIVAHIPVRWVRIAPPRKMSDEQREAARQRLLDYHERRAAAVEEEDEDDD